jgi:diguanylate cyclase (GGDEF)-like protein
MAISIRQGTDQAGSRLLLTLRCLLAIGLLVVECARAASDPADAQRMLERAEQIKIIDPQQFAQLLGELAQRSASLPRKQREHLEYLQAWKLIYTGDYRAALPLLQGLSDNAEDVNVKGQALATVVNTHALASNYEQAFPQLNRLLDILPQVTDKLARQQGMEVAAYLYGMVGETDLALNYAQKVIDENPTTRGACRGNMVKLQALYKRGSLKSNSALFTDGIDACVKHGDLLAANVIRSYVVRLQVAEGNIDGAIRLLRQYYQEVQETRYPRGISEWDSLLAQAHQMQGDLTSARQYALRAIETGVKNQPTEPIVTTYRVLYEIAAKRGDTATALSYLEKYVSADKGYLDDVSARQLAYERAKHENAANKLQIEALNQENKLLQLQRQLDSKAAEASRLYIALLLLVLVFIALWAYRTKRSQLYFMKLSQVDGLTGISNRPRFLDLAENVLESARKSGQQVSVVLCDLDYFKAINDRYGHAAGDHVLRQAVNACQTHLRVSDIFGRVGGEEFGVVLPGCGLDDAKQRAERLRAAVKALIPEYEGELCPVSASFGVTSTEISGYELRELLAHADWALYRAKAAGRDRVMPYEAGALTSTPMPSSPSARDAELRNASRA